MKNILSKNRLRLVDLLESFPCKATLLFLFCIGINNRSNAQLPTLDWVKQFNTTIQDPSAKSCQPSSLQIDASGNIITVGVLGGSYDFNPGTNPGDTFVLQSSSASMFVSKLDSQGNYLWAKRIWSSVTLSTISSSVAVGTSGSVYVAGSFYDTGHFDNITVLAHPSPPGFLYPLSDGFVSKQDAQGNFVWVRQIGGGNNDFATSIATDPTSRGLIVTGTFYDTVHINTVNGPVTLTSANDDYQSVFVCKLDTSGNFLWAKQIGGGDSGSLAYPSLCLDAQGNILLAGTFGGTVDFDPGTGNFTLYRIGWQISAMFVCKLDPQGNFIWAGATEPYDYGGFETPPAITADGEGNIYTTGNFSRSMDFDPGQDTAFLYASNDDLLADIFVCKWNASGSFGWVKGFNRTASDTIPPTFAFGNSGTAVSVDQSGNVFTSGYFYGVVDFNPGTNDTDTFVLKTPPNVNGFNGYISKLNAQGNFVWAFQFPGANPSVSTTNTIHVDDGGNIFSSGTDYGTIDFDPNGTYNLAGTGAFILKLKDTNDNNGNNNGIPTPNEIKEALQLYPNPAGSEIWLKNDNRVAMKSVLVYNILGQVVFQKKIENKSLYLLDVRSWTSGMYFVRVGLVNGKVAQGKFEIRR